MATNLRTGALLQNGKYKIEKMLGQGGFGITYLAEHTLLESKVAIKEFFFREYCERDEETSYVKLGTQSNKETVEKFRKKFLNEAKTISKLQHPNIIKITDFFRENNTAYYVMEFIDGESLGDMVKRTGPLPEADALKYIRETAEALDYIHSSFINHLDIKPGNIMVRRKNNRAVLIDFGVSKQYDMDTMEGTKTTPRSVSHGYSPPEQYNQNGVDSFSPQSDIYALGATLLYLLTAVKPPESIDLVLNGLESTVEPLLVGVSDKAKKLVLSSMQIKKQDRPQDAKAFLKLMDSLESGKSEVVKVVSEDSVIPAILVEDEEGEQPQKSNNIERKKGSNSVLKEKGKKSASPKPEPEKKELPKEKEPEKSKSTVSKKSDVNRTVLYTDNSSASSKKKIIAIVTAVLVLVGLLLVFLWSSGSKPKEEIPDEDTLVVELYEIAPYEKACLLLADSETSMDGIAILDSLTEVGDARATYLLSRIYFVSNNARDNDALPDTIKEFKQNLPTEYISANWYRSHGLLETCVQQDSTQYNAWYELGLDYLGGSARQGGVVRDIAKAKDMLRYAKEYAEKAGDAGFAERVQKVLNSY